MLPPTKCVYQPLQNSPEEGSSIHLESSRRSKSCSLYVVIFFILVSYIILSILLPDTSNWLFSTSNDYEDTVYHDERIGGTGKINNPVVTTETPLIVSTITTTNGSMSGFKLACDIPRLDPYDKTIKHLIEDHYSINCTVKYPLLFETYTNSSVAALPERIREGGYESCCYKSIYRKNNSDGGYKLSDECTPLDIETSEPQYKPLKLEFIGIYCVPVKNDSESDNSTNTTSTTTKPAAEKSNAKVMDVHVLVNLKPATEQRVKTYYDSLSKQNGSNPKNASEKSRKRNLLENEKVNVVMLGIDAVSHMNFIRTMPSSYAYVMNNLSAVEMQGYNKIGDNTFPNLVAVLTSLNTSKAQLCEKGDAFDECPFIWKQYAAQGFRTSYGEDSTWMGIFNYLKSGFKSPPTDYYLRPFGNSAGDLIGHTKRLNAKLCYGPRLSFQVLLGYMKKLAFAMGHHKRYFQLIWATSLTHDFLNAGLAGDTHLLEMLRWFKEEGHFNQTVFILMSDHGIRWGSIHNFRQGQLEERLPFLYFIMPDWFKKKYSLAVSNLEKNVPRLTTPYDLHETLKDLLDLTNLNNDTLQKRTAILNQLVKKQKMPRGISHFLMVPPSRTCKMAAVEDHYCTCHQSKDVPSTDPTVQQVANYVVFHINVLISKFTNCAYLTLGVVKQATLIISEFGKAKGYQLILETVPGGAIFETSVEKDNKNFWQVSGTISRTNLYGNQSHCVMEKEVKMFCYCLDVMTNKTVTQT